MKLDRIALWTVLLAPPSVVVTFETKGIPFHKSWRTQQYHHQRQRDHQQQQQLQLQQRTSSFVLYAGEDGAADDAAADAAGRGGFPGGGLGASGVPLLVGPVAALAAGRQALQNREVIKKEVRETENQLEKVKLSLSRSDNLITTSFSLAAITSVASLGAIFGTPAVVPSSNVVATSSSTVVTSSAAPVAIEKVVEAPVKIKTAAPPVVSIPEVPPPPTPPKIELLPLPPPVQEEETEKPPSAFRFKLPATTKVAEESDVVVKEEPKIEKDAEPQASAYETLMDKLGITAGGERKSEPVAAAPEVTIEAETKQAEKENVAAVETEPDKPSAATSLIEFLTKKPESETPSVVAVPAPPAVVVPEEAKAPVVKAEEKAAPPPAAEEEKIVEEEKPSSLFEFLTKKPESEEPPAPAIVAEEKEEKKSILESLMDKIAPAEEVEEKEEKTSFFGTKKEEAPAVIEEEKKSVLGTLMERLEIPPAPRLEIPAAPEVEEKKPLFGSFMDKLEAPAKVETDEKSAFGSFMDKLEIPGDVEADPIVVGAVGVAALGVFAALLAANEDFDQGSSGRAPGSSSYLDTLNSNKYGSVSGSGPQSTGSSYLSNLSGKTGPASYADKLSGGKPARVKPSSIKRTVRSSGMAGSSTGYMDALSSGRVSPMKSSTPPMPERMPTPPPQKPTMEKKADAKPVLVIEEEVEEAPEVEALPAEVEEEKPVVVEATFKPAGSVSYLDRLAVSAPSDVGVTKVKSYGPSKWSPSKSTGTSSSSGSTMRSYLDNIGGPSQEEEEEEGGSSSRKAEELPSINELAEQRGKEEPSIR